MRNRDLNSLYARQRAIEPPRIASPALCYNVPEIENNRFLNTPHQQRNPLKGTHHATSTSTSSCSQPEHVSSWRNLKWPRALKLTRQLIFVVVSGFMRVCRPGIENIYILTQVGMFHKSYNIFPHYIVHGACPGGDKTPVRDEGSRKYSVWRMAVLDGGELVFDLAVWYSIVCKLGNLVCRARLNARSN